MQEFVCLCVQPSAYGYMEDFKKINDTLSSLPPVDAALTKLKANTSGIFRMKDMDTHGISARVRTQYACVHMSQG